MSVYIDKKYISLLAPKLTQFKQRGEFLWNFRCPVCGDSQKDKIKARGYIYKRKENFGFMCHNCGSTMKLNKFIKYVDPALYNEYQLETFVKANTEPKVDVKQFVTRPVFNIPVPPPRIVSTNNNFYELDGIIPCHTLDPKNPAKRYLKERQVPLGKLFYTDDFAQFVKTYFPNVDKQLYKEARIVIPFFNKDGFLIGVQGRAIGPSKIKYITIKIDDSVPKIFGWDRLDPLQTVYVVEGPIDSLFLTNSVATMDAALYTAPSVIGLDKDYVFVYDNEPRNKQIVSNMRKTIDMGRKICVWPSYIKEKDINEMVLVNMHPSEIQHIIDRNTHEGIMATMKLNQWSRI
jgi:transcription elongation factor Elf1